LSKGFALGYTEEELDKIKEEMSPPSKLLAHQTKKEALPKIK
jgi:hypothetical protein